jgi:hypothetical protein
MNRLVSAAVLVLASVGFSRGALAERPRDVMVFENVPATAGAPPYNTLFLNRCKTGCIVHAGTTNSTTDTSSIVSGTHTLGAFPYDDAKWAQVVSCVKDTFESFKVVVTDVDPGTAGHFEIMIGNLPGDLGMPANIGGVSPYGCGSLYIPNALVFDFAGVWGGSVEDICSTAAQEIAHSFALDHSTNASDPMTYFSYGGRRYFADSPDPCGSDCVNGKSPSNQTCTGSNAQTHTCICSGSATQNSFQLLTSLFGAGMTTPPVVAITNPQFGASVKAGFNVTATATDDSLIKKVELRVDNVLVDPVLTTQPYAFSAPSTLGDGTHHVEVTAYDSHGTPGKQAIDVTIGPPCGSASDCPLDTDACIGGRCVPGPGVAGGLGMPCTTGAQCAEGQCASDGTNMYCVSSCMTGQCPKDFGCEPTGADPNVGVCWPGYDDGTGGCSVGAGGSISFGLIFAALLFGRRRRT